MMGLTAPSILGFLDYVKNSIINPAAHLRSKLSGVKAIYLFPASITVRCETTHTDIDICSDRNDHQCWIGHYSVPLPRQQKPLLNVTLTFLFYFLVVAVLLAWLYPPIKRLVMLQQAANKFGTGDISSRTSPSRYSYIASIETDFNRMANQIQTLVDNNHLLSRAVSHNLKTPITRLRMGIDVLEEAADSAEIDGYVKRINKDLDEMQALVDTLLQYSSLDEFELRLQKEPVDLCQFIPELIDSQNSTNILI